MYFDLLYTLIYGIIWICEISSTPTTASTTHWREFSMHFISIHYRLALIMRFCTRCKLLSSLDWDGTHIASFHCCSCIYRPAKSASPPFHLVNIHIYIYSTPTNGRRGRSLIIIGIIIIIIVIMDGYVIHSSDLNWLQHLEPNILIWCANSKWRHASLYIETKSANG